MGTVEAFGCEAFCERAALFRPRRRSRGRAGSDPAFPSRKVGSIEWKPHLSFGYVDLVMLGGGTKTPLSSGANILPLRRAAPSLSLPNAGRPFAAHGNGNPVAGQACRDPRSGSIDTPLRDAPDEPTSTRRTEISIDLMGSGRGLRHLLAALDPPHRAASPAIPAFVGSGSPLSSLGGGLGIAKTLDSGDRLEFR